MWLGKILWARCFHLMRAAGYDILKMDSDLMLTTAIVSKAIFQGFLRMVFVRKNLTPDPQSIACSVIARPGSVNASLSNSPGNLWYKTHLF